MPATTHSQYHGGLGGTQDWEMGSPVSLLVPSATTPQKPEAAAWRDFLTLPLCPPGDLQGTQERPGGGEAS